MLQKSNESCAIGVALKSDSGGTVTKRKAGARILAVRCLTYGGGEESDGLDSSFCDIAARAVIPSDRATTRNQYFRRTSRREGWGKISAPADVGTTRRERGRTGAETAEQEAANAVMLHRLCTG